jgi:hypothetical protein
MQEVQFLDDSVTVVIMEETATQFAKLYTFQD